MDARAKRSVVIAALAAALLALAGVLIGSLLKDGAPGRDARGGAAAPAKAERVAPGRLPVSVDAQQVKGELASSSGGLVKRSSRGKHRRGRKGARRAAAGRVAARSTGTRSTGRSAPAVASLGRRVAARQRTGARRRGGTRRRSPRRRRSRVRSAPAPIPAVAAPLLAAPAPSRARRGKGHAKRGRRHGEKGRGDRGGDDRGHGHGHDD